MIGSLSAFVGYLISCLSFVFVILPLTWGPEPDCSFY